MKNEQIPIEDLRDKYSFLFKKRLEEKLKNPIYREIFKIAEENLEGRKWIIGGFVYRNIIEELYSTKTKRKEGIEDIDFLGEKFSRIIPVSYKEWSLRRTDFLNPYYLRKNNYRVDLNDIPNFFTILLKYSVKPTIENIIDYTPLNIQSIAWEVDYKKLYDGKIEGKLIGDKGIKAIHEKNIVVNNIQEMLYLANKKGRPLDLEYFVKEKAEQLVVFNWDITITYEEIIKILTEQINKEIKYRSKMLIGELEKEKIRRRKLLNQKRKNKLNSMNY